MIQCHGLNWKKFFSDSSLCKFQSIILQLANYTKRLVIENLLLEKPSRSISFRVLEWSRMTLINARPLGSFWSRKARTLDPGTHFPRLPSSICPWLLAGGLVAYRAWWALVDCLNREQCHSATRRERFRNYKLTSYFCHFGRVICSPVHIR